MFLPGKKEGQKTLTILPYVTVEITDQKLAHYMLAVVCNTGICEGPSLYPHLSIAQQTGIALALFNSSRDCKRNWNPPLTGIEKNLRNPCLVKH